MADLEITEDVLLNGKIRVRQPKPGYPINVDTLLLAATLPDARIGGGRVAELCCGVGAALLAVATGYKREGDIEFVGIERDPLYARLARENVELNGQAHRTMRPDQIPGSQSPVPNRKHDMPRSLLLGVR